MITEKKGSFFMVRSDGRMSNNGISSRADKLVTSAVAVNTPCPS